MNTKLRPWTLDDLERLVEEANNIEISKNLSDAFPHPYSIENGKTFIEMASKDDPIHIFAIEHEGRAIGGIGIHPQSDIFRKNAELGYWLGQQYWNNGIMSKFIPDMVNFAFKTYDINRVFARVFGENISSQKALEKCGFILESHIKGNLFKNGKLQDELIYSVRK